jgi:hypothetical protein
MPSPSQREEMGLGARRERGYLDGWIHREDQETAKIVMSSGGEVNVAMLIMPSLLTFFSETPSSAPCPLQGESPKV